MRAGGHGQRVLRIQDIPYKVLLVILQYMYNCLEEIDENMLMDVFKASKVYGMTSLHNDCFQHLKSMIDVNNGNTPPSHLFSSLKSSQVRVSGFVFLGSGFVFQRW
jgi:hypothetical protein